MQERLDIWVEKFSALCDVVGRVEALNIHDSITDLMQGVGADFGGTILSIEDTINSMTDAQFNMLIECLTEAIAIESEIRLERERELVLERARIFDEWEL